MTQGTQKRKLVGDGSVPRQQFGDEHARDPGLDGLERPAEFFRGLGFGVPGVDVADTAVTIKEDDRGIGPGPGTRCS
jgi:hypothetical protein